MLCFSIRRTMMVDVGFLALFYVHDKRGTGKEEGEQKQAPSSSGVFVIYGDDAMIPPLAVLCTHVFTLSLERSFRRW
jgi:hypothetical protein